MNKSKSPLHRKSVSNDKFKAPVRDKSNTGDRADKSNTRDKSKTNATNNRSVSPINYNPKSVNIQTVKVDRSKEEREVKEVKEAKEQRERRDTKDIKEVKDRKTNITPTAQSKELVTGADKVVEAVTTGTAGINNQTTTTVSPFTPFAPNPYQPAQLTTVLSSQNALNKEGIAMPSSYANTPFGQSSGAIAVVCRFRPLNDKEKNISMDFCADFLDQQSLMAKSSTENSKYKFTFDRVFDNNCKQIDVYEYAAKPIVESVLEGFNGTIFAYGQTSSGKTFTMTGVPDSPTNEGIIPRMINHVFNHILQANSDLEFTVKVSMIEIYMEKIKDLVTPTKSNLNIREDKAKGIYIEDLSEHYVINSDEVMDILKVGNDNRATGATNMNEHSSRSHSIFIMTIHQTNVKDLTAKTGKLYLVDLAGSEKTSKTGATGLTLEEAKTINKSLTTLGMVINSLTDGKSTYVPYRDSKLTRVLQESLGGNAKTCLIITCSPSIYNEAETLSTLRFGLRAKKIKNKPKINKEITLLELKNEITRLEGELAMAYSRISKLEKFIKKNGLKIPAIDEEIKSEYFIKDAPLFKPEDEVLDVDVDTGLESGLQHQDDGFKGDEESTLTAFTDVQSKQKRRSVRKLYMKEGNTKEYSRDLDLMTDQLKYERLNRGEKEDLIKEQLETIQRIEKENMILKNKIEVLNEREAMNNEVQMRETGRGTKVAKGNTVINPENNSEEIEEIKSKYDEKIAILMDKIKSLESYVNPTKSLAFQPSRTGLNSGSGYGGLRTIVPVSGGKVGTGTGDVSNCAANTTTKPEMISQQTMTSLLSAKSNNATEQDLVTTTTTQTEIADEKGKIIRVSAVNPTEDEVASSANYQDQLSLRGFEEMFEKIMNKLVENKESISTDQKVMLEEFKLFMSMRKSSPIKMQQIAEQKKDDAWAQMEKDLIKNREERELQLKRKNENEKKLLLKSLEEKSELIAQYEIDAKEYRDTIKSLESKLNPSDRNYSKKIVSLEKNLDQLNQMLQKVVTEKSSIAIDKQITEQKLKKFTEKAVASEKEIGDLKDMITSLNEKIIMAQKQSIRGFGVSNNMVKVIKGGERKQFSTSIAGIQEERSEYQ